MYSEIDKQMMLKFLEMAYPVSRIKFNHKFRRAIRLESGIFMLSDVSNHKQIRFQLAEILKKVFACEDAISYAVLDNFLNLK